MVRFFAGGSAEGESLSTESEQQDKWFRARWDGHEGWARESRYGHEFSVELPEAARKYPESVVLSAHEVDHPESAKWVTVSYRSGENSWELLELGRYTEKRGNYLEKLGAHIGERGIEDRVPFDKFRTYAVEPRVMVG